MFTPSSVKEVEQFCGLNNFYERFITNFTTKSNPTSELQKTDTTVNLTTKCQSAVNLLNKELASEPLVQSYSLKKEIIMTNDASKNVMGGAFSQEWHRVIHVSRRLSAAELRYSNIEKEALAVVYVNGRQRQLLLERKLQLNTDQKLLEFIFSTSKEISKTTSVRISRLAISLIAFSYDNVYQESREYPHADAMSCLQFQTDIGNELGAKNVYSEVNFATCKTISLNDFKPEYLTYPLIPTVIKRIISGKWLDYSQPELPLKKLAHFLTVENGIVYNGTRPFVHPRLRRHDIERAHENHEGTIATRI